MRGELEEFVQYKKILPVSIIYSTVQMEGHEIYSLLITV
jgi:hypothetical protein